MFILFSVALLFCCSVILSLSKEISAATISLPATGQTKCYDYDTAGAQISCAGTGQDGAILAGTAWPNPRFTDNGNSTVSDNLTGLIWTQDANAPGPATCNPGVAKTWQGALDYAACLNTNSYLGYNDWRLPNINELRSLTNAEVSDSSAWLNTQGFINAQSSYYWSSSTYAYIPYGAWNVYMGYGDVNGLNKTSSYYVWPVRGGQSGSLCNLAISPSSQTFTSSGGAGSVTVTASASSCAWTASSSLSWVTITSGSGTGSGTATFAVAANTSTSSRTGNIDIAGQTFTISQSAAPSCAFIIKPTNKSFTSRKGNVVVDVTATGDSCTLSPTESYDWITAALSGKFTQNKKTKKWSGKVKVDVTENKSSAIRTGTVDIGGQTFTVTQSGVPCTLKISPETTKKPLAGAGGTDSFKVTTPDGCNWTATPDKVAWLTISSGSSGSGAGTVSYTASENTTTKKRTGKINVVTSDKKSKKVFTAVQNKPVNTKYTDNGNGTIKDNTTGLTWQKGENSTNWYNWYQASGNYDTTNNPSSQNVCGSLSLAGGGWRLPSLTELESLIDNSIYPEGTNGMHIDTNFFPNAYASGHYWSSTTWAYNTNERWYVNFYGGYAGWSSKDFFGYVRCVRG